MRSQLKGLGTLSCSRVLFSGSKGPLQYRRGCRKKGGTLSTFPSYTSFCVRVCMCVMTFTTQAKGAPAHERGTTLGWEVCSTLTCAGIKLRVGAAMESQKER